MTKQKVSEYIVGVDDRLLSTHSDLVERNYIADFRNNPKVTPFEASTKAVALVITANSVHEGPNNKVWIEAVPERMRYTAFSKVPRVRAGIHGGAFLVADGGPRNRRLITALHVVDELALERAAFIFGFSADKLRAANEFLPQRYEFDKSCVFKGESLIPIQGKGTRDKLAVITLDRYIDDPGLQIVVTDEVAPEMEVALVGHARMQPLTLTIRTDSTTPYPQIQELSPTSIITNVDAFQGSSGSPLMSLQAQVLGVHVALAVRDYNPDNGEPYPYPPGTKAATALRLSPFIDALKRVGLPA